MEAIPTKGSEAIRPASSAASKYRSQYADMNQDACGAGVHCIHSLHTFQSIDQVFCSRHSAAALQPALKGMHCIPCAVKVPLQLLLGDWSMKPLE